MERMSTELYKAAVSGEVAALEQKKNVDIFTQVSHRGDTALHISAFHGRRNFVEKLLQLVKKPDEEATNEENRHSFLRAQNEDENSALHEAVKGGDHDQIVKTLIEADAELAGIRNNKGESPLFTASAYGRCNALKMLLSIETVDHCYARFDGQTCLHHALFYQNEEVAMTLIDKAPELCNLADYFLGRTPLHIAALHGCSKSVHKLLERDTSSSFTKDKIKQQTALHLAAQHGHTDIVRCILNFAEDCLEIRDEDGKTALHYAVENAKVGVVRYLVSFARVVNIADKNGYTALDIANQKFEEEPLSPYFAIWWFLSGKKGIVGVEAANQTRETLNPFPSDEKYSTKINSLSVCAILIATVTFQAVFTLPDHDKDKRGLSDEICYQGFVFFDWLAFCFSMAAAILLAYATFFRHHRSLAVGASAAVLSMALYSMMISFSLAIFLQVRKDYYKLALFFFGAMFLLAPLVISVILAVLHNAIGFRVSEFIGPWFKKVVGFF